MRTTETWTFPGAVMLIAAGSRDSYTPTGEQRSIRRPAMFSALPARVDGTGETGRRVPRVHAGWRLTSPQQGDLGLRARQTQAEDD